MLCNKCTIYLSLIIYEFGQGEFLSHLNWRLFLAPCCSVREFLYFPSSSMGKGTFTKSLADSAGCGGGLSNSLTFSWLKGERMFFIPPWNWRIQFLKLPLQDVVYDAWNIWAGLKLNVSYRFSQKHLSKSIFPFSFPPQKPGKLNFLALFLKVTFHCLEAMFSPSQLSH